jgi:hypothetical protein
VKGILVHVLRFALGDCTNGGASSRHATFVLTGPGLPELFAPDEGTPELRLESLRLGGTTVHRAFPVSDDVDPERRGMIRGVFGGNYVVSSDARFVGVCGGPIRVMDRCEEYLPGDRS